MSPDHGQDAEPSAAGVRPCQLEAGVTRFRRLLLAPPHPRLVGLILAGGWLDGGSGLHQCGEGGEEGGGGGDGGQRAARGAGGRVVRSRRRASEQAAEVQQQGEACVAFEASGGIVTHAVGQQTVVIGATQVGGVVGVVGGGE